MSVMFAPIVALIVLLVLHFGGRFYLQQGRRYAENAGGVWDKPYRDVERFIGDAQVPDRLAEFVYAAAMNVGRGKITNRFLLDLILGRFLRTISKPAEGQFADSIAALNGDQSLLFSKILSRIVMFDSLQLPLRGLIVRRALWWLQTALIEKDHGLEESQLERVALSARQSLNQNDGHESRRQPALAGF